VVGVSAGATGATPNKGTYNLPFIDLKNTTRCSGEKGRESSRSNKWTKPVAASLRTAPSYKSQTEE